MEENNKNTFFKKNSFRIKKQNFVKNQGYIFGVTALIIVGIILLNVLVGMFSSKLEFDFSTDKANTISEENREYIENLKTDVTITVCADEKAYADESAYGMKYYAYNYYYVYGQSDNDYYLQTQNLIKKYAEYNDKISVNYIDIQSTEFASVMSKYPNENLRYGDIIVASEDGSKYKVVTFEDIYELSNSNYSYYVSGNNIETALTSAVDYVVSGKEVKVALLAGHSSNNYTENYVKLLEQNNYTVETVDDKLINSISKEYDAIIIASPNIDFLESEIAAIEEFLDNGTTLGKGLIYFADSTAPVLPNFVAFLESWGISQEEGMLFETAGYHAVDDATSLGIFPSGNDSITTNMNYCICGFNVPLTAAETEIEGVKVTPLMVTSEFVVNAPVGVSSDWDGYEGYEQSQYAGVIMAEKSSDNTDRTSQVVAFSSVEFIESNWVSESTLSNQDISLAAAEVAASAENSGISFTTKTFNSQSYYAEITDGTVSVVSLVFVKLLPLAAVLAGVIVFFTRRRK